MSSNKVVFKHALRAAIVPIVTIFGLDFASLLAGTIFTEYIFGIDGIGNWAIDACPDRLPGHLRYRSGRRRLGRVVQPGRRHRLQLHRPESETCMTEVLDGRRSLDPSSRRRDDPSRSWSSRTSRCSSRPHDGLVQAVTDLSYTVKLGETLGIVGESGSGKSVSSMAVLGLHDVKRSRMTGSIRVGGTEIVGASDQTMRRIRGNEVAMIFQDPLTALHPFYTIGQQIIEAYRLHNKVSKKARRGRGRSRCSTGSASRSRTGASTTTRTSSPAACGSAR